MRQKPGCEGICGVDGVEVVQITADHRRAKARPNQLGKQDVGQTHETVAGKQLSANFNTCFAKLVDPSRQSGMRNAEVTRELLAGDSDHHVLHQGMEKLVEFSVHQLFGGYTQVNIHGWSGVCQRADRDVVDAGFGKASHGF